MERAWSEAANRIQVFLRTVYGASKVNPPFLFIRLVGFDWSNFPLHVEDPESGREPAGQTTGVGKHESKAVKGRGAMR